MISESAVITNTNLSLAWTEVLRRLIKPGVKELSPLVVSITDIHKGHPLEEPRVREVVDAYLQSESRGSIQTVANTIFPVSLWNPSLPSSSLYQRYAKILPRIRRNHANQYGLYFARMMAYQPKGVEQPLNQLDYIVQTRAGGNPRRSAYQLAILDPTRDHTNQRRRGFPCLQQVSVLPNGKYLTVCGYYASQVVFARAYGNFLGLWQLGKFLAHELDLELSQVTCVAAVELLDMSKEKAEQLLSAVERPGLRTANMADWSINSTERSIAC